MEENKYFFDNGIVEIYDNKLIMFYFDYAPDLNTCKKLKEAAFKWSPKNQCWQRKLTNNALYSTKKLLHDLKQQQ